MITIIVSKKGAISILIIRCGKARTTDFFLDPFAWFIQRKTFVLENRKTFRNFIFFEREQGRERKREREGGERERL